MIVAGAKGHAVEVFDVLKAIGITDFVFYDDVNLEVDSHMGVKVIHSDIEVLREFLKDTEFIIATGSPESRYILANKLINLGGELVSVISNNAFIGYNNVKIDKGCNVMHFAMISSCTTINEGTLINAYAAVHHGVIIGKYCEISPRASILGGARIGSFCSIGAGAIIFPDIEIGNFSIIGAGSVVTKNVEECSKVVGIPGIKIGNISKF